MVLRDAGVGNPRGCRDRCTRGFPDRLGAVGKFGDNLGRGRGIEEPARLLVRLNQGLDASAQGVIAAARLVEEGGALVGG